MAHDGWKADFFDQNHRTNRSMRLSRALQARSGCRPMPVRSAEPDPAAQNVTDGLEAGHHPSGVGACLSCWPAESGPATSALADVRRPDVMEHPLRPSDTAHGSKEPAGPVGDGDLTPSAPQDTRSEALRLSCMA